MYFIQKNVWTDEEVSDTTDSDKVSYTAAFELVEFLCLTEIRVTWQEYYSLSFSDSVRPNDAASEHLYASY